MWVDLASGYKADAKRPDFDKALAALRNRDTSALWCYMVDRFSRQGARAVLDVIDPADGTEHSRLIFEYDNLDSANERDKLGPASMPSLLRLPPAGLMPEATPSAPTPGTWLGPWGAGVPVPSDRRLVRPGRNPRLTSGTTPPETSAVARCPA
ncbi:hypothetical protein CP974_02870 [Streptomyces fradiae ATCC 10745 = DSM 40063]|uniref:Resolvase/invertase-type recombinase catalytic domain-containing protein n=2 Tax=Streptomyces TaxID=1883 RepID=A0A1D8FX24_9ACTN|nr:hypothetical protein A4G23_00554 [Streptomyces rubrolavendulae]OSY54057.1 hypothetical protein BG846_00253 [Streptomyces fradiae ATCC 10745 = DSM 40063]QEV11124.1 hypothetical protein CP974_02870 [Streptomyces fradiae ATCC 10745 = DSM 40063]